MFDRFTDDAKRAMNAARIAAQRLGHSSLGTEHVLLGLLDGPDPVIEGILERIGVEPAHLRAEIERQVSAGPEAPADRVGFTPQAAKVLEFSMVSALDIGDHYIGTEHILMGVLREEQGLGARVLALKDITREKVKAALASMRGVTLETLGERGAAEALREMIARLEARD